MVDASIFLEEGLKEEDSSIAKILLSTALTAQVIYRELSYRIGKTEAQNPFGERQAELDVFSNASFADSLSKTGVVASIASEEMEDPLVPSNREPQSYHIAMDPIDGSSNITTNNPLGSIFGIWNDPPPQRGKDLVASAFVTYGPTLSFTYTTRKKVIQYIEAKEGPAAGRFILSYPEIRLPEKPEVYGIGGDRVSWIPPVVAFVNELEKRKMRLRYGGTFIGDYNQILQRGGIFSYPALLDKPKGKFRLMYETAPISLITEIAGGRSSNGKESILEIMPESIKETSAFYTGNKGLVSELEKLIRKNSG